ncbi:peroxisomal membrane protein 11B-like [Panonychus citri]|uniref:peroxisomal membrane protein 11B-like n=1 Tax=Panonychus citri TaxID=50023 RepID=UPI002307A956|nr:peroxisomal membrane protein 11B-like [Panonychus citri]
MEQLMRLNSQTSGRDKVLRLWQFSFRLAWSLLEKKSSSNMETIARLKEVESLIGFSRRLLRLGRSVDLMYSSMSSLSISDPILRMIVTSSRISSSLFLFADHLVWLKKVGLLQIDESKWSDTSNRFWLYSSILNLLRDCHEIKLLIESEQRLRKIKQQLGSVEYLTTVGSILLKHKNVSIDTVKNICDTLLPMASLGQLKVSPSKIGLIGIVSSTAAILQIVNPSYRL